MVNEATVSAVAEEIQGEKDTMEIGGNDSMGKGNPDLRSFSSNVSDKHNCLVSRLSLHPQPVHIIWIGSTPGGLDLMRVFYGSGYHGLIPK